MMMVRTEVYRELGGFASVFDPHGPEDIDFSLRLRNAGYDTRYVPAALGYHRGSQTFGAGRYSLDYTRNRVMQWLRFLWRHGTLSQRIGFFLIGAPYRGVRIGFRFARALMRLGGRAPT
jgi:GT2 family glycosyltransferase